MEGEKKWEMKKIEGDIILKGRQKKFSEEVEPLEPSPSPKCL